MIYLHGEEVTSNEAPAMVLVDVQSPSLTQFAPLWSPVPCTVQRGFLLLHGENVTEPGGVWYFAGELSLISPRGSPRKNQVCNNSWREIKSALNELRLWSGVFCCGHSSAYKS